MGGAVHEPEVTLARGGVLPEDVGFAVAVEVSGRGDGPLHRHDTEAGTADVVVPFMNQR